LLPVQSPLTEQSRPSTQSGQVPPPQSMSVSVPFLTPSVQVVGVADTELEFALSVLTAPHVFTAEVTKKYVVPFVRLPFTKLGVALVPTVEYGPPATVARLTL
jgi:hypothetical protein